MDHQIKSSKLSVIILMVISDSALHNCFDDLKQIIVNVIVFTVDDKVCI